MGLDVSPCGALYIRFPFGLRGAVKRRVILGKTVEDMVFFECSPALAH